MLPFVASGRMFIISGANGLLNSVNQTIFLLGLSTSPLAFLSVRNSALWKKYLSGYFSWK